MSGLDEPGEFAGGNEGNIAGSSASNDHRFLLVHNLIEKPGKVFTETRIRCFSWHLSMYRTVFLYVRRAPAQAIRPKL